MKKEYANHELNPFEVRDFWNRITSDPSPFMKGEYSFHGKDLGGIFYVEVFHNGEKTNFQYGYIAGEMDKNCAAYEKELNRLTQTINVRLTEAQFAYINEIAKTKEETPSDIVRQIIEYHMNQR